MNMNMNMIKTETTGQRIQAARLFFGFMQGKKISQKELASQCGWENGQARITNYERDIRTPSANDIAKIAKITGTQPEWIQFGNSLPVKDDTGFWALFISSVSGTLREMNLSEQAGSYNVKPTTQDGLDKERGTHAFEILEQIWEQFSDKTAAEKMNDFEILYLFFKDEGAKNLEPATLLRLVMNK